MARILVWDFIVRLFHLLVVVGFASAYVVAKFMGEDSGLFPFHMMIGLSLAAAVLFRVVWGFIGTKWARLSTLFHAPKAYADYMKGILSREGKPYVGHNPASSLAIVAILLLIVALATTGYLMSQGFEGLKQIHELCANLLALVSLAHIGGVLLHAFVHRDGIIASMIHGRKWGRQEDAIAGPSPFGALLLLVLTSVLFGGLVANYNPRDRTTAWPVFGGAVRMGEGESGERHEERKPRGHEETEGHERSGDDD